MTLMKLNKRKLKTNHHLNHHLVIVLEINILLGNDPNPGNAKCQNLRATIQNQRNPVVVNDDPGPVIVPRTEGQETRNPVKDGLDLVNVAAKTGNVPDHDLEITENPDQDLGKGIEIENNVQDLDPGTEEENVQDQNQRKDQIVVNVHQDQNRGKEPTVVSVPDQNQRKGNAPDQETENVRDPDLETENDQDHVIGDVDHQGLNRKNVVINVIENVPIAQDQKIENPNSPHHLGQENATDVMILLLLILQRHLLQVQTENKSWHKLLRVSYHSPILNCFFYDFKNHIYIKKLQFHFLFSFFPFQHV